MTILHGFCAVLIYRWAIHIDLLLLSLWPYTCLIVLQIRFVYYVLLPCSKLKYPVLFNLYLISDKSFIKLYISSCLFLYTDNNHIEHTTELSCIISGLKEQTTYNVQVCATSAKGRGPKANLDCVTANLGK